MKETRFCFPLRKRKNCHWPSKGNKMQRRTHKKNPLSLSADYSMEFPTAACSCWDGWFVAVAETGRELLCTVIHRCQSFLQYLWSKLSLDTALLHGGIPTLTVNLWHYFWQEQQPGSDLFPLLLRFIPVFWSWKCGYVPSKRIVWSGILVSSFLFVTLSHEVNRFHQLPALTRYNNCATRDPKQQSQGTMDWNLWTYKPKNAFLAFKLIISSMCKSHEEFTTTKTKNDFNFMNL